MKCIACLSLALAVLAACPVAAQEERSPSDLYATWRVDRDKQLDYMKSVDEEIAGYGEEQIQAVKEFLGGIRFVIVEGSISVAMSPDAPAEDRQKASLVIVSREGDVWKIETKDEEGEVEKGSIEWVDADHIKIQGDLEQASSLFHLVRVEE